MAETVVTAEAGGDVINSSDSCHVTCIRECVVLNKIDDVIASNQNDPKSVYDTDDRLSVCSTPSEGEETMGLEERPSSALSCSSSKGSRIPVPRLCRSSSVRHSKNRSYNDDHSNKDINHNKTAPFLTGLQRSQSFATSRGMAGLTSSAGTGSTFRSRVPLTPELKRKKATSYSPSSYVSPYSMKVIASERKTQNSCAGSELSEVDNEDNISERSFSSASVHGCCDKDHTRSGAGLWGGRRPKNILHCSHAHDQHDPDDYLTPTQRAARKIRELAAELKKARREIFEKDTKISALTRDLVELRIEKASRKNSLEDDVDVKDETSRNVQKFKSSKFRSKFHRSVSMDDKVPNLSIRNFSPSGDASCVSPPSVGSDAAAGLIRASEAPSSPVEASIGDSDSGDLCRSLADSGHYEDQDLPSPCLSPRDSLDIGRTSGRKLRNSFGGSEDSERRLWTAVNSADENIRHNEFSRRIEDLKENHMEEYQELKERYNDRVEMLLSKLSDSNLKYFEIRPLYDKSLEKIRDLEKTNEKLKQEVHESELRQQKIYLQMYLKGQQAAKLEAEGQISSRRSSESEMEKTLSDVEKADQDSILNDTIVISLMRQLTQTEKEMDKLKTLYNDEVNRTNRSRSNSTFGLRREEIDPAITLQFLKSAIYYFLTDRENAQGHLRAIESILGYSSMERGQINKHVKI